MRISKSLVSLKEPLDIDLQLMAAELDTSAKDLKYLSDSSMEDALSVDSFNRMCDEIKAGGEVTSFNDYTVLYEYLDEAVVYHETLGIKFVIFDASVSRKMENRIKNLN